MIDWEQYIEERTEWVEKNFPPDTPSHSMLGVIEEMGELSHSYLKNIQGIRGDEEKHILDMKDAVGDMTVYLWGVLKWNDYQPYNYEHRSEVVGDAEDILFRLSYHVGQMAMTLDLTHLEAIPYLLMKFCQLQQWDYEEIVKETWNRVKQRDWTKNKHDGVVDQRYSGEPF